MTTNHHIGHLDDTEVKSALVGKYRVAGFELSSGTGLDARHGDTWIAGRVEHAMPDGYYWLVELGTGYPRAWLRCSLSALERAGVLCRLPVSP